MKLFPVPHFMEGQPLRIVRAGGGNAYEIGTILHLYDDEAVVRIVPKTVAFTQQRFVTTTQQATAIENACAEAPPESAMVETVDMNSMRHPGHLHMTPNAVKRAVRHAKVHYPGKPVDFNIKYTRITRDAKFFEQLVSGVG